VSLINAAKAAAKVGMAIFIGRLSSIVGEALVSDTNLLDERAQRVCYCEIRSSADYFVAHLNVSSTCY
jgi:hypothetical protein